MPETSRDPVIGDWRGEPTYRCPLCAFETMVRENFDDHMRAVHYLPEGADQVEDAAEGSELEPVAATAAAEPPVSNAAAVAAPILETPPSPQPDPQGAGEEEGN